MTPARIRLIAANRDPLPPPRGPAVIPTLDPRLFVRLLLVVAVALVLAVLVTMWGCEGAAPSAVSPPAEVSAPVREWTPPNLGTSPRVSRRGR